MRKRLWLAVSLLVVMALLVGGCAGQPEGMKSLRWLTEAEKAKVIEIALNTPQALKQLEKYSQYKTDLSWIAIVWDNSEYSEYWGLDYEWVEEEILPPLPKDMPLVVVMSTVPESAEFYSRVVINLGEPPQWQVMAAINPDTGKVALVEENPFRRGPTPAKDSHPEGMESLRWLTEAEKAKAIEIALNTPEAKEARGKYGVYRTGFGWLAIKSNESGGSSLWGFDYEMVDNIPENIPRDAEFYSQVEIYFGEPEQLLMRIAVNLDTGEVAHVERHGLKILPK